MKKMLFALAVIAGTDARPPKVLVKVEKSHVQALTDLSKVGVKWISGASYQKKAIIGAVASTAVSAIFYGYYSWMSKSKPQLVDSATQTISTSESGTQTESCRCLDTISEESEEDVAAAEQADREAAERRTFMGARRAQRRLLRGEK